MFYDSNKIQSLKINIKGIDIELTQIKQLLIKRNIFNSKVVLEFTFNDITSILDNLPIRYYDELTFNAIDASYNFYQENFTILNIKSIDKINKFVTIQAIDTSTFKNFILYKNKGYKDKDIKDIVKEYYNLNKVTKENNKYVNLTLDKRNNINFQINKLTKECGLYLYKDRNGFNLLSLEEILENKTLKEFVFKSENEFYKYNVYDYKQSHNFLSLLQNSNIDNEILNPNNSANPINIKNDYISKSNLSNVNQEFINTNKKDINYYSDFNPNMKYKQGYIDLKALQALSISLLTSGNFDIDIGEVDKFLIDNRLLNYAPNFNISDKYLVYEVIDYIITPYYFNKIKIVRDKYML